MLGFSTQGYNKWRRPPVSQRVWDDAHLTNLARDIYLDDPEFGYRFVSDEIAEKGVVASERRVWRTCSEQQLWSLRAKKRGLTRKAGPPVHDDLVLRHFTADRSSQIWLTDISEHRTDEGKLYLCAIKDMYSRRIVGCSNNNSMTSALAVSAVRNAVRLRGPVDTILHAVWGSQFRSNIFARTLKSNGLTKSRAKVGACGDNAAMGSFFSLLQKNVLDRKRWVPKAELRFAIVT